MSITHIYARTVTAVATALLILAASSCSTTRRLGSDDILYTGVKKIDITTPSKDIKPAPGVSSDVFDAVNVKPNNSLYSPYLRYPFPLGLWVYNNWSNPPSGFKHWIYEKLVAEPVLISDVRPEVRVKMINQILEDNGYFQGHASYELIQGKNKKKARILYNVSTGPEYPIDSIILLPDTCRLNHLIDSVAMRNDYLQKGARYCIDSLSAVRVRIANAVRNKGYYFFKPDYIEYLADSTINKGAIALKLTIDRSIPQAFLASYRTGNIVTRIHRNQGGGTPDTIMTNRGEIIQWKPSRLREELIPECITFRTGRTFSVRDMNRTQTYLSRLGIFNGIDINVVPDTTLDHTLNVEIDCKFDAPLEASIEVNATSKSNSYIGPGVDLKLTNHNIFGGGEQLSVDLFGTYEWQTGRGRNSVFNSYEVGLNGSLSFPRLLAPRFIPRTRRQLNWTRITLGADLLNRPHYFNMAQFNTSFVYDWRATRHVTNSLTLFKLTYVNLMRTTTEFDSIMNANPAIAQSFRSQFIPQMSFSYTYDRAFDSNNSLNWQFTVQEAGNIFWSVYELCGKKGEKKLFGTPFSQFVKAQTQLVYNRRLKGDNWLVSRIAVGAAHAYGNSTQVPYSEQFYVGGANSIRAFTVRSIGPGSYRVPKDQVNGYFDQTGTFKFEFNVEYRFPIISVLHGALFLDSGNVWLLKNDPERPGGQLKASTFFKDIALGTGVGLRVDISMMVVRLDLGIGIHAPYDTGKRGYYNMTKFKDSLALHLAIGYPF
ncbi:MAG: BamA/TamA family outer membrane protein [Bacteroides sp.]|nr:BamA/TamA family outer membrane protein [Bacteroides sp.]MCM1413229.1 BamA/TamA family outer membrane protein [Bacteroides sp.]MCM1471461.1 BamA/TamA family outer membrane protein [Bacteroides sp.]